MECLPSFCGNPDMICSAPPPPPSISTCYPCAICMVQTCCLYICFYIFLYSAVFYCFQLNTHFITQCASIHYVIHHCTRTVPQYRTIHTRSNTMSRARTHDHRVSSQRHILSRHTGRTLNNEFE